MSVAPKKRNGKWKRVASQHTNIRLPLPLRQRLESAAERSNRTVSSMGAECIRLALDGLEGMQAGGGSNAETGAAAV